ncbi:MAG: hypothetical protein RLZZ127_1676, partial [Planctomycetota bacterium]
MPPRPVPVRPIPALIKQHQAAGVKYGLASF